MQTHVTKHMRGRHAPAADYRLEEAPFGGDPVCKQLSPSLAASPWGSCCGDAVRSALMRDTRKRIGETHEIAVFRDVE